MMQPAATGCIQNNNIILLCSLLLIHSIFFYSIILIFLIQPGPGGIPGYGAPPGGAPGFGAASGFPGYPAAPQPMGQNYQTGLCFIYLFIFGQYFTSNDLFFFCLYTVHLILFACIHKASVCVCMHRLKGLTFYFYLCRGIQSLDSWKSRKLM